MIFEDFALLASDTPRTKAYIQMMVKNNYYPGFCIVFTDEPDNMKKEADEFRPSRKIVPYFDLKEPVLYTILSNDIDYVIVSNKDINSNEVKEVIKNTSQKYVIYSGYGGYILKPDLFKFGKKYIHVHAGILPEYRGSTTAYYSMLQEGYIGATAIFLSEGIDEGEIITSAKFSEPEKDVNVDILYEPFLRAKVLKMALEKYMNEGELGCTEQNNEDAQTYYIIHPVLKHIALMSLKENE